MRFLFIDEILEQSSSRVVAIKHVAANDAYLQDHFRTFPVVPGVIMLEALAQTARSLLCGQDPSLSRLVIGRVRAFRYGAFVKPGDSLRLEVDLLREPTDASAADAVWLCRGAAVAMRSAAEEYVAAAGRFALRRIALAPTHRADADPVISRSLHAAARVSSC